MKLFSWGTNSHGQLGHGCESELENPKYTPFPEPLNANGLSISGGGNHTIILNAASCNIYGVGLNSSKQLPFSNSHLLPRSNLFSLISATFPSNTISKIVCGWDFSLFLSSRGILYGCGSNSFKQLENSSEVRKDFVELVTPRLTGKIINFASGLRNSAAIDESGKLHIWGDEKYIKNYEAQDLGHLVKVSCGQQHIVVLNTEGRLLGWGSNRYGQCGLKNEQFKVVSQPSMIDWHPSFGKIIDLVSGWSHSIVLTDQRHVYTWGRNTYGQLGRASSDDDYHIPTRVQGLEDITSIAAGSEHSMALSGSGQLWTWGWNEHGTCGNGNTLNQLRPVNISNQFPGRVITIGCGAGHCFALTQ